MNNITERIAKLPPEKRELVLQKLREKKLIQAKDKEQQIPKIVPISREQAIPLSFAQQRLWFLDRFEGSSATYNLTTALRLSGELNTSALQQSLETLIQCHETLRTRFPMQNNGQPVQNIAAEFNRHLPIIEQQHLSEAEQTAEVQRLVAEEAQYHFNLAEGPLLRFGLFKLADTEHVLWFNMHHIITDAWSIGIMIREISTLYSAYIRGESAPLPVLSIQYADFAHWQRQWFSGEEAKNQLNYWLQQLADAPALL